ncbi:hypothetical protein FOL47_008315 [Perkinsus chesapeaki]|uniref:Uncharacterized protein n=1 Tax=Perkinsus chesapeaki TaxID=330153 RepID=A0A7J6LEY6_PERCH|nr:hypothetical protein FOL47_008315 [Perkinsus chesapeaki]
MTGLKSCGDPKYSVDIGKYGGMRNKVRYEAYVYAASKRTFSATLNFTTDAGPYTCRSHFRYEKTMQSYPPEHDGCIPGLLAHIGLEYLHYIFWVAADDPDSLSLTLGFSGLYKVELTLIEAGETLKVVDHGIPKSTV